MHFRRKSGVQGGGRNHPPHDTNYALLRINPMDQSKKEFLDNDVRPNELLVQLVE